MECAKERRNEEPVMAVELSRKTGLVVKPLDSTAVEMLFAAPT